MMITAATLMIFATVFLVILALFFGISAARRSPAAELKRRLQRMAASADDGRTEAFASELLRENDPAESFFRRLPLMSAVKRLIIHSGVTISLFRLLFLSGAAAMSGFIVVKILSGNILAALLAMCVLASVPSVYLGYRKQQRKNSFDEQLPDALTMVARSLRAGHSLAGAIELISQEMPEPTGGLFRVAYDQQQLGMRITDSLRTLLEKVESIDLHFFVTIVRINSDTGGNLSEILDKLSDTVRSRLQIRRQVRVYSAQGRMSGLVLTALPVVVFVAFSFLNPGYMKVFYTERLCQFALLAALLAQCAGFLMIRKIVAIRI